MGKVLGIVNRKGGVGKTTTATTMSYLLSKEGCKVALIDFDGQRHTTKLCGVTAPEQLSVTIYDILKCIVMNEELPDKGSYMIRTETGVDLIPANNKLDNFDKLMCDTDFAEYKLKEFVDTIKEQYDYILIDCPPSLEMLTVNALCAAGSLLVPVQCEYYALEGLSDLMNTVRIVRRSLNPRLELEGVLLTMFDGRNRLTRQVQDEVNRCFPEQIFKTVIPRTVRLSEAPSFGKSILHYDIKSKGSEAYLSLAKEIVMRKPGSRTAKAE